VLKVALVEAKLGVRKSRVRGLDEEAGDREADARFRAIYLLIGVVLHVLTCCGLPLLKAKPCGFALTVDWKQCSDWLCKNLSRVLDGAVTGSLARIATVLSALEV